MPPPAGNHRRRRTAGPASRGQPRAAARPAGKAVGETSAAPHTENTLSPLSDGPTCPVCASDMENVAVGGCGHGVCASCSHRMRFLYRKRQCAFCKEESKQVFVVPFAQFEEGKTTGSTVLAWAQQTGTQLHLDKATNMMFVSMDLRARLQLIAGFTCPRYVHALVEGPASDCAAGEASRRVASPASTATCSAPSHRNVGSLRAHVRDYHTGIFCDVCISSKTEYKSMLPVYPIDSSNQVKRSTKLAEHMKAEHPMCKYCSVYMLDDDELYEHMRKNHESCHLCERDGILHEYFRNFSTLEAHYRSHHFVCEDSACQGVVFGSMLDLQAHVVQHHRNDLPRNARGRRLQVDLSELHAGSAASRGGGGGRGDGGGRGGRGGRGGGVVVNGLRHGLSQSSGTGVAASGLLTEEDVRQEQERQAARIRAFVAAGGSSIAVNRDGSSGTTRSESASRSGNGNEASTSAGMAMPRETVAARRGRRITGAPSAPESTPTASTPVTQDVSDVPAPDDDGFYERVPPEGSSSGPPARERSKALVALMRSLCDPAEFEQFRTYSGDFRSMRLSPEGYYNAAVETFGVRNAVRSVLPELAALLPTDELRLALVDVCVRRNPPKNPPSLTSSSVAGPSQRASSRPSFTPVPSQSIDSFPSLSGAPANASIRPSAPRMRVAPPKADDFPSLGKASGSSKTGAGSGAPSGKSRQPTQQPSMARVFGAAPAGVSKTITDSTAGPTAPAASAFPSLSSSNPPVATPKPVSRPAAAVVGARPAVVVNRTSAAGAAPPPAASAFPSLSATNPSSSTAKPIDLANRPKPANMRNQASMFPALSASSATLPAPSFSGVDAPSPDVTERGGAVWGGAGTALAHGSKKRGPGKGRGRTPAPMPDLNASCSKPSLPLANAPRNAGDSAGSGLGSGGKVIDIPALALQRQAKSALPRVSAGGSYGFAWERKKVRTKQAEIKRDVKSQATTKSRDQAGPASVVRPVAPRSSGASSSGISQAASASSLSDLAESSGTVYKAGDSPAEAPSNSFDQFSYLASGNNNGRLEDPASSFLGS